MICYQHKADSISARSKSNVRTAREQSLHGAGNFLARHREAVPVLGIGHSHGGNDVLEAWKEHVFMGKVPCLCAESMLFFHRRKYFFVTIH